MAEEIILVGKAVLKALGKIKETIEDLPNEMPYPPDTDTIESKLDEIIALLNKIANK